MRSMVLLLFTIAAAQGALAQGAPIVRQTASPAEAVVVGQRIALTVDVLFDGGMTRPPRVAIPEVPGLQIFRFETQGTTMSDRIDGVAYSGQRFEFALYPRRGGSFIVPPAAVTLLDRDGNPSGTAAGAPTRIEVRVPAGVDASKPVIASTGVRLSETWSRPAGETLRVGDALRRTILREAIDVPALAMLPVPDETPDGVRAYREPEVADDRITRGSLTGRRTDTLTYQFEKAGAFALPPIAQPWWDLRGGTLRQENAPGLAVTVAAALAEPEAAPASGISARALALLLGALVLAALAAWLVRRFGPRLAASWRDTRRRRASSEAAAFHRLRQAAASGAAGETYRAASAWRAHLAGDARGAADRALDPIEQHLFGPGHDAASWTSADGGRLIARLARIRREARSQIVRSRPPSLPPLNPVPHP